VRLPSASLLLSRMSEIPCDLTNYRFEVLEANQWKVLRLRARHFPATAQTAPRQSIQHPLFRCCFSFRLSN